MSSRHLHPDTVAFTILLGMLAALPALSIDISQPMLLAIQTEFEAPASIIGLTITVFMFGFAAGQFAAGPLSDQHGRRSVLRASLIAYVVSALGCSTAHTPEVLLTWRFVQGAAAGACTVLSFAVIRDLFEGDAARAKRSYVTVAISVAPLLAPALGAWVLDLVGWRPVYLLLSVTGLLLMVAVLVGLGETRPVPRVPGRRLGASYAHVVSDRRFFTLAVLNALSYGCIFAYIAASPLVLMGGIGLSTAGYGAFFACTAASLTAGAFVSGRCTRAGIGTTALLWAGLALSAAAALLLTILLALGHVTLAVLLPLLLLSMFARGLTGPNVQHMALDPMREQAGTAAAAIGVSQTLVGAMASAVVAVLVPWLGPQGMALVMAALALASFAIWIGIARRPRPVADA